MCDPVSIALAGMGLIGQRQNMQAPPEVPDVVEGGAELEAARENTGAVVALGDDRDEDLFSIDPLRPGSSSTKKTTGSGLSTSTGGTGISIL